MRYSVYFFLVEPTKLNAFFSDQEAPERVVQHLKSKRPRAQPKDCDQVRETIRLLQENSLGSPAETYRFESFLWALDLLGEPINLSTLVNFNRYNYFSNSAMYPQLRKHQPVLPVPNSNSAPEVLFLPSSAFQDTIISIRNECKADECRAAEEEVADILESATEESIDLWGISID